VASFDLSADHPLRAELIRVEKGIMCLCDAASYCFGRGASASILVRELVELYGAYVEVGASR